MPRVYLPGARAYDFKNRLAAAADHEDATGDTEKAKSYYAKLLAICDHADGDRPELQDARSLLAQK